MSEQAVMFEEVAAIPQEAPPTPTPTPRKRNNVVSIKNRSLEELHDAPVKSMSDSEKKVYIEALREAIASLETRTHLLEENCNSAYEKCRQADERFINFRNKAQAKLQFARQAVATCNASIILAGSLEEI